ncbi:MAG: serine/threonine-protein kinase [Lysobacterales bacterium]
MSELSEAAARWQRLSALFEELLDLDDAARAQRLYEVSTLEPDLAPKLRRMLDAHRGPAATLDGDWRVAMEATSQIGAEALALSESPTDRSGESIDEYLLLRRVGRGGMGEVYLAERTGGDFAQRVALKLLRRGVDTEDVIRRFVQERSILARLEHPAIARLIDGGMGGEGLPYLVMEYVEGEPLTAYARSHDLDVEARLRLLIAVSEAVDFAHRRLVVHRDLKPSNVLVAADGSVKLLDFGIAKLLDAAEGDEALTGTGMRVLSPAYAAPEQFLGEPIGTATDVYALGVMLFELLTAELPHQRNARSLDVLARGVTQERIEKPSVVLRRHSHTETARRARRLEGDLDTIVLTALKREPERRYASAAAFAQDLRAYLEGRPIAARPDTFGYRAGKFVRRNRFAVGSASLVLLAIVAGLAIALWQTQIARGEARRADREAARATAQASYADHQRQLAERTRTFVVKLFTDVDPLLAREGSALSVTELVRDALARLDTDLADAPDARAELRVTFARALNGLGQGAAAVIELERGIAELQAIHKGPNIEEANALMVLANVTKSLGDNAKAEAQTRASLAMFNALPGDHREERIQLRTLIGNVAMQRGNFEDSLAINLANLADRESLHGKGAIQTAVDHNNLCVVYFQLDRYTDAEREGRKTLELLRSDPDSPRARQAWALSGIGNVLIAQGRYAEATAIYDQQERVLKETLPPDHSMQGSPYSGRARIAFALGDVAQGEAHFRRAAAIYARAGDQTVAGDAVMWGRGLLDNGRDAEALGKLAKSFEIMQAWRGPLAPDTLRARALYGQALARNGKLAEGEAHVRAALVAFERQRRAQGAGWSDAELAMADLLKVSGREAQSDEWRERGIASLAAVAGEQHPRVIELRRKALSARK